MARGLRPGLAVILVGDAAASAVYVRNKVRACEDIDIESHVVRLPATVSDDEPLSRIDELNAHTGIHGILVPLPLPAHIGIRRVLEAIAVQKDVDGFHLYNVGGLVVAPMVKHRAVVIDVGINRLADGRIAGDVDFDAVKEKASFITPVPGGVGPMTVTMLLVNTIRSAEIALQKSSGAAGSPQESAMTAISQPSIARVRAPG